jgi:hypothetical protein
LRSRGGHDFPALIAARFISRIATICRACDLVSSRRLARPPRRPIVARYFCKCFLASVIETSMMHHKRLTMHQARRVARESSASLPKSTLATGRVRPRGGLHWALRPRNSVSDASNQLAAAALARARRLQSARKAFILARSTIIRVGTPVYFFVAPVTVRLTAPWWTRP